MAEPYVFHTRNIEFQRRKHRVLPLNHKEYTTLSPFKALRFQFFIKKNKKGDFPYG